MSRYHSCGRHPRALPTDRSPFGQTVAPKLSIQCLLHTAGTWTCAHPTDHSATTTNHIVDSTAPVMEPTPFANEAVHGEQLRPLTTQPTRSQRTLEWTQAGTVRIGIASVVLLFLIATIAGVTTTITTGWFLAVVAVLATHHRRAHSFTAQPAPGRQTLEWTQAGTVRRVLVPVALLFLIATTAGVTTTITTGWFLAVVAVLATHHRRAHSFTAQPAPGRRTLEWTQAGTVRRVLVSVALLFRSTGSTPWITTGNPGHTMDRPALSGADLLLAPSSV